MSSIEQKEHTANIPLPLDRAERGAAEEISFRGSPIAWVEEPKIKRTVTANAFGPDEIRGEYNGCRHLITYDGRTYEREEFLRSVFQEYKKYPYRVKPLTDDIFRLLDFILENGLTDILINRNEYSGFHVTGTGTHSGTGATGPRRPSSTRKYICPCCGNSVRATKSVNIACLDCDVQMVVAG